ncbi:hypothetical protein, partial [Mycobacterium avium]
RNRVTAEPRWPRPAPPLVDDDQEKSPAAADGTNDDNDEQIDVSKVIPLPVFDARKEAKLWRL